MCDFRNSSTGIKRDRRAGGDGESDVYGSGAFSFSGLVGPEPVAEADADAGAAFSPAATLVGVAAPLRAFAVARACACIWWCLDLPDAASATILRDKGKTSVR